MSEHDPIATISKNSFSAEVTYGNDEVFWDVINLVCHCILGGVYSIRWW